MRSLNLQLPAWLKTLFKATLWLTAIPLVFILVMAAINFWDEPLTEQSTAALTWQSPSLAMATILALTALVNQVVWSGSRHKRTTRLVQTSWRVRSFFPKRQMGSHWVLLVYAMAVGC